MKVIILKPFDVIYCDHCKKYSRIIVIELSKEYGSNKIILECGQEIHCGQHPKNKPKVKIK